MTRIKQINTDFFRLKDAKTIRVNVIPRQCGAGCVPFFGKEDDNYGDAAILLYLSL